MKKDIINVLKVATIGLALTAGTNYLFAAWSAPTATPPNGNVEAPINVSATGQTKTGNLIIQGLDAAGNTLQNGLIVTNGRVGIDTVNPGYALEVNGATKVGSLIVADGTQGAGKVLTDVNGDGVATWQSASAGGSTALDSLCVTTWIPPFSGNGTYQNLRSMNPISLLVNNRNVCTDDNGCSYRIWSTTDTYPSGTNFYTSYPVMYRQLADGNWTDAYGNQKGINSDSVNKAMISDWNGFYMFDDYTYTSSVLTSASTATKGFGTFTGSTFPVGSFFGYNTSPPWWKAGVGGVVGYMSNYNEHSPNYWTGMNLSGTDAEVVTVCDL